MDSSDSSAVTVDPQHRHHRPHRRRQDDHDRAHPVLHRRDPPDGGRRQGDHDHRLPGRRTGAGDHDRRGGDHLPLEGRGGRADHDQHHRHARPRRFHRRGRAVAPRPRRRDRDLFGRRGGRGAERDGLAAGDQVPRPPALLHQQDGPHRRRVRSGLSTRSSSGSRATRSPCRSPSAPGPRGRWASSRA